MKKWVTFFFLFVSTIFCTYVGYVYTYRTDFLSHTLSCMLGVQVKMKSVDFSKEGLKAKDVRIHNPTDCTLKNALFADKVIIKMDSYELFKAIFGMTSERIVIRQIKIEKPKMHVEFFTKEAQDTNWGRLIAKIAPTKHTPTSRQFEIQKLTLTNVQLEAKYHLLPKMLYHPQNIARIELTDIGHNLPATPKEAFCTLFTQLINDATKQLSTPQQPLATK